MKAIHSVVYMWVLYHIILYHYYIIPIQLTKLSMSGSAIKNIVDLSMINSAEDYNDLVFRDGEYSGNGKSCFPRS